MKASMDQYSFKVLKIVTGKFSQKKKKKRANRQTNQVLLQPKILQLQKPT